MTFLAWTGDLRFTFVLARALGMTVGELEDRMTYKEFEWWKLLYNRETEEAKAQQQRR